MPFHVAAAAAEPAGASHQLTAARKKEKKEKEKQQLPICGLPASLLQQNQPEQTGNSPSPILLPPSFYPLWSSHLTALRFLQSSCSREGTGPKKKKSSYLSIYLWGWEPLQTAGYHLHLSSHHPSIPLLLHSPPSPRSLPPFPPASNSQSSALPLCLRWEEKSDGARKKGGGAQFLVRHRECSPRSLPPPNWWQGWFLLSGSSANGRTVPGNTAVELHWLWCLCWFQCVRTMFICVSVSSLSLSLCLIWVHLRGILSRGKLLLAASWTDTPPPHHPLHTRWNWDLPALGGFFFEMSFESGMNQSAYC